MAYQSKTYALSDEVIAWLVTLKDDYGSVNKGLLAVIALRQVDDDNAQAKAVNILPSADILEPVSDNRSQKSEGTFRRRCIHTGCRGAYFKGTSKFQTLCGACANSGHAGDPRNCKICYEDGNPA